jgi:hypothetical protein
MEAGREVPIPLSSPLARALFDHAVAEDRLPTRFKRAAARRAAGLSEEDTRIMALTGLDPRKKRHRLGMAMERIFQECVMAEKGEI